MRFLRQGASRCQSLASMEPTGSAVLRAIKSGRITAESTQIGVGRFHHMMLANKRLHHDHPQQRWFVPLLQLAAAF